MTPGCQPNFCSSCQSTVFVGCAAQGSPFECPPPIPCPFDCQGLDEATCWKSSPCQPQYCPGCLGQTAYAGCTNPGEPGPSCPALGCPSTDCGRFDEMTCLANSNFCHALYKDDNACGCAQPGCCAVFAGCGEGVADCFGPAYCSARGIIGPPCEGPFTNSYRDGCFEACVQTSFCPAP